MELWNEPWEGISISGWGADIPRYRNIYRHMADGVLEAREKAGVKVLIGGTSSSANARDKLFSDGSDQFLPIFDFVSIHYQALGAGRVDPGQTHQRFASRICGIRRGCPYLSQTGLSSSHWRHTPCVWRRGGQCLWRVEVHHGASPIQYGNDTIVGIQLTTLKLMANKNVVQMHYIGRALDDWNRYHTSTA